jgi:hypothetical protein
MNKIIISIVVLVALIGLFLLILIKSESPFGKSNSSFASEPQNDITKIEFSEGNRSLLLEKEGENWLINGKIEARKSGIQYILKILKEQKIKSPVSPELFESEITSKAITPVRVKVYEKRRLLKTFFVYKTNSNSYGNVMKIKEGTKPFIVYVPGFEGDIGSGFTLNELFWKTYIVFNLMPSEIASVTFLNVSDSSSSFSIVNNNNRFVLSDLKRDLTGWDSSLVVRYLSYFVFIPFESWALEIGEEEKKRIELKQPLYKLLVSTVDGNSIILTLWERMIIENGVMLKDTDRLYGKTKSNDEFFIMRYFDIDPLLKKRSYFFHD